MESCGESVLDEPDNASMRPCDSFSAPPSSTLALLLGWLSLAVPELSYMVALATAEALELATFRVAIRKFSSPRTTAMRASPSSSSVSNGTRHCVQWSCHSASGGRMRRAPSTHRPVHAPCEAIGADTTASSQNGAPLSVPLALVAAAPAAAGASASACGSHGTLGHVLYVTPSHRSSSHHMREALHLCEEAPLVLVDERGAAA